jgi:ribonucleotide monophosphatase NagD (HAD superfamily)
MKTHSAHQAQSIVYTIPNHELVFTNTGVMVNTPKPLFSFDAGAIATLKAELADTFQRVDFTDSGAIVEAIDQAKAEYYATHQTHVFAYAVAFAINDTLKRYRYLA